MPLPVIDCRTLSVPLTLNNFSYQMKSNYITATRVGWFSLCVHVRNKMSIYIGQRFHLVCWVESVEACRISNTLLQHVAEIFNWFLFLFLFMTWRYILATAALLYGIIPKYLIIIHHYFFCSKFRLWKEEEEICVYSIHPAQMCEESKRQSLT